MIDGESTHKESMQVSQPPVGFIGLGQMGLRIAERIAAAGNAVLAFDIRREALEALVACGNARAASCCREVADECEIVFGCLPTVAACEAVVGGAQGLVLGHRMKHFVHLSTTGSGAVRRLAQALEQQGCDVLDAPVSGGPSRARAGRLVTMASGSAITFAAVEPLLRDFGTAIHLGERPGAAQSMKMINGMVSRANMAIACEAMVMAAKAGLDPKKALEVLNQGTGQNDATLHKMLPALDGGKFGADLQIVGKDMDLWQQEVDELGLPSPLGRSTLSIFSRVLGECGPTDDVLELLWRVDEWSGHPLRDLAGLRSKL